MSELAKNIGGHIMKSKASDVLLALVTRQNAFSLIKSQVVLAHVSTISDRAQDTGCATVSN